MDTTTEAQDWKVLPTKKELLANAFFNEIFMYGNWCVVGVVGNDWPWIVHYCWDSQFGGDTWNYVRSTPLFIANTENKAHHYTCCGCAKKAPDDVITIQVMMNE